MTTRGILALLVAFGFSSAAAAEQPSLSFSAFSPPAHAGGKGRGGGGSDDGGTTLPTLQSWMSTEVGQAWEQGYFGQDTSITVIDDFTSSSAYGGDLGTGYQVQRHGEWTLEQAGMIGTEASMSAVDFSETRAIRLKRNRLDTLNLSYGMIGAAGYDPNAINWDAQTQSIIDAAQNGLAVASKAAGNSAVAVDGIDHNGNQDYLNLSLIGGSGTLFVGALSQNGSVDAPASLAGYSNYAGDNTIVQDQFLVVGVEGNETGLYGTSFAAPVVSGYSAILGSKFTNAGADQIAQQLLDTARTDTISGYSESIHGQGEASIARALAPASIN